MRDVSRELGYFRVWMKGGNSDSFVLHRDSYPECLAAWMGGKPFYTAKDEYGDPLTLKLGEVVAISLATPEAIAVYDQEEQERKFRGDE